MSENKKTVRLCHFSDLHLVPDKNVPIRKLFSKRILGYANLRLNRGRTHTLESLRHLLRHVVEEKADQIVVTGDFTSLALNFEFATIDSLFKSAGLTPETTLVIPGNHDRYTMIADKRRAFERGLADWLPVGMPERSGYPIVAPLGPVMLIGLDTAVWRNPARAAGAISRGQLKRLKSIMEPTSLQQRWPVIAMHHPPIYRGNKTLLHYRTGLSGFKRFVEIVDRPATIIHGHMHIASRIKTRNLDIIGVPSASNNTGAPDTQLAYYVYTFDKNGLIKVEACRLWPQSTRNEMRLERVEI